MNLYLGVPVHSKGTSGIEHKSKSNLRRRRCIEIGADFELRGRHGGYPAMLTKWMQVNMHCAKPVCSAPIWEWM
jgi:hypothetical protein